MVALGSQRLEIGQGLTSQKLKYDGTLTDTLGNLPAPESILFAGDQRFANDLVTSFASILGQRTDLVRLYAVRCHIRRSDQRPAVHPIISCDAENAMRSECRLWATDFLAAWRGIAPETALQTDPLGTSAQSVRIGTRVEDLRSEEGRVLQVPVRSERYWGKRAAIHVFTVGSFPAPVSGFEAGEGVLTTQDVTRIAVVLDGRVDVVVVTDHVGSRWNVGRFAGDY